MDQRPATIKDVANLAGVSASTVSNVLLGQKAVRPALRERVVAAVAELNYRADPSASQLRTGRSRIVGMVVPSIENPFFAGLVAAVERLCQRDGYELVVASSAENSEVEAKRIAALLTWRPAGLIVLPYASQLDPSLRLEAVGIPLVVADRAVKEPCDFVEINNEAAGQLAARHLVTLGHRRIAAAAPNLDVRNIQERIVGIAAVLQEAGLEEPVLVATGRDDDVAADSPELDRVLQDVTAIIALTSTSTLRVLAALARTDRVMPSDVSLVGFDDYSWMAVGRPSITAVRQPVAEIGEAIWALLGERIQGLDARPVHRQLNAELVVRGSTAEAPAGENVAGP